LVLQVPLAYLVIGAENLAHPPPETPCTMSRKSEWQDNAAVKWLGRGKYKVNRDFLSSLFYTSKFRFILKNTIPKQEFIFNDLRTSERREEREG
jgi:hypothetical protein